MNMLETIKKRKSIRTFDGREITPQDKEKLLNYMENIDNPYGVKVEFIWLDKDKYGLSSPVIKGEAAYIAAKVKNEEHCEEAFGYSFEKLVLFACQMGIGTTWIAGTFKRALFEQAANVKEGEFMMCVTPIGYPTDNRSIIDRTLRKQVKGDERLPVSQLFFENSLDNPVKETDDLLEAIRWAPSAANRQPVRVIKAGNKYHFYKNGAAKKAKSSWDVQKVDLGIAMCHLMSMTNGTFEICDPEITEGKDVEYIATIVI